ncbi:unnamed protein product [Calicophoron daubneyi]|uniref:CRAL-TRIO domain-containing protein n=1 Tax=Calicophoron daubneyi TaxID=300641 RepID=A0AAV2TQZ7_CALDB
MHTQLGYDKFTKEVRIKAKEELHENPDQVEAHLKSFRRWVSSLPHIHFPSDDRLLIPFLRHAKYVHAKAQTRLDNFCTIRKSKENGSPELFDYPPIDSPVTEKYLESGTLVELGRIKDGCTMYLIRPSPRSASPKDLQINKIMAFMDFDRYLLDPTFQVAGCGLVMDFSQLTTNQLFHGEMKPHTRAWQEGYPLRIKRIIFYNPPQAFDALFKIVSVWLSAKVKQRTMIIRGDLSNMEDVVPGLKDIMPLEYGGRNDTIKNLAEDHKRKFLEFYSKPSPWDGIEVDESKRPETAKNLLRQYANVDWSALGAEGTYIELKQD